MAVDNFLVDGREMIQSYANAPFFDRIQSLISSSVSQNGGCHVMLTGGRSAARFYSEWMSFGFDSENLSGVQFYFGDERCVPPDDPNSNYGMVMSRLFPNRMLRGAQVHRMPADSLELDAAAHCYDRLLPEFIDVLLLSIGEDGHIASLFPHSPALRETRRRVALVTAPKAPFRRITITPPVIESARHVFVIAAGEKKREMYEKALREPEDIDTIPARLVLNAAWIFGD